MAGQLMGAFCPFLSGWATCARWPGGVDAVGGERVPDAFWVRAGDGVELLAGKGRRGDLLGPVAGRAGHAAGGARSAPQTSAMSAIPIQPVPSVTGTCRIPPLTMVVAASRMLVAAGMAAGWAVSKSWIRVVFTSMPTATARAISAR